MSSVVSTSVCELAGIDQSAANAASLSYSDDITKGSYEEWKDCVERSLGLFYLMLESKLIVPVSTVQSIAQNLTDIHELNNKCTISILQALLKNNAGDAITAELVNAIHNDAFSELNALFSTDYKRKAYFKKVYAYIEPTCVRLGLNRFRKERHMHYVPILKTLTALLGPTLLVGSQKASAHLIISAGTA